MKTILKAFLIALFPMFAFAQNAETKSYYSFNHKAGDQTLNWGEFSKARKELKPVASGIEIKSFTVSITASELFVDEKNTGNQFSEKTIALIEKFRAEKKLGTKIVIADVVITENGEEKKASGMVIKIY